MPLSATVRFQAGCPGAPGAVARAGRDLAAQLGRQPGFVTYLLVQTPDGGLVSVHVYEDATSLAAADRLVAAWVGAHLAEPASPPAPVVSGEIIVQKGL